MTPNFPLSRFSSYCRFFGVESFAAKFTLRTRSRSRERRLFGGAEAAACLMRKKGAAVAGGSR
jgi:hypothetical protein